MTDPRGFLQIARKKARERPVAERVRDYREVVLPAPPDEVRAQATRCMDCGIPFCHRGCPLENLIPEWNDLVSRGELDEASERLGRTNNFPEITGRVCPAPCEASCVLNLEEQSVTIKTIERTIADHAMARGLVPQPPRERTGRRAAVVGSGPAGLAAAQELARAGHDVTVFERDDRAGGLLRYGIPDFKLEKATLDRRLDQMRAEGVVFRCGVAPTAADLAAFDAVVLAVGARRPRDLAVPGRDLAGVHFAMEFLEQQNRRVAGAAVVAKDKRVVVIGGGDTGADCVGTSIRQGAASVLQLEILPRPSETRLPTNPWPEWPLVLRTSSSHEEGAERDWAVMTRALRGEGSVRAIEAVRVRVEGGAPTPIEGSDFEIPCDLVLLAMGFTGPETDLPAALGLELDARGNVRVDAAQRTSAPHVFAAGDASRGQSLVVWAIADGRRAAVSADAFLASSAARAP
jgi:glutamate synthase (NADPH/NADH) small chain